MKEEIKEVEYTVEITTLHEKDKYTLMVKAKPNAIGEDICVALHNQHPFTCKIGFFLSFEQIK
jgi:hypothetical protein